MISFSFSSLSKRRGTTLAGVFSLALSCVVLLCGAGSVPVENLLPQGAMQGDLNAGGHNLTNAATVSATNVVVSGSLTAPSSFTLPFSKVTSTPTTLSGYGIADPIVLTNGSYANPAWITSLAYSKLTGAPTGYTLPAATTTTLGGVIVPVAGGLTVDGSGNLGYNLGAGLSLVSNALAVNTSQSISTLSNLTSNGLVTTSGGTGALSITTAPSGAIVGTTDTQTLTNKSIASTEITGLAASATTDTTSASNITSGNLPVARLSLFLAASNTFALNQTLPAVLIPSGPTGVLVYYSGDSRVGGSQGGDTTTSINGVGYTNLPPAQLQECGFFSNALGYNGGLGGSTIGTALIRYDNASVTTTGNVTSNSLTITITGSTSGLSGTMAVGGVGIPIGMRATISGSTVTLQDVSGLARKPTISTTGATLNFSAQLSVSNASNMDGTTGHQASPAITTNQTGSFFIIEGGVNDCAAATYTCGVTSGSANVTTTWGASVVVPGTIITSTHFPGGTVTVLSVSTTGFVASANATGSNASESITTTPVASAIEAGITSLVNLALADSYKVQIWTMPKDYGVPAGDANRLLVNAYTIATYGSTTYGGSTVAGVTVVDSANLSCFSTNDPTIYLSDGIHMTPRGYALWTNLVNEITALQYPALTSQPIIPFGNHVIPYDWLALPTILNVGTSTATGSIVIANGGGNNTSVQFGTGKITYNQSAGYWFFNNAGTVAGQALSTAGVVPTIANTQTTVNGTASGSIIISQPLWTPTYKRVLIYCNALSGTASYTFPTAFVKTPSVVGTDDVAVAVVTSKSTTAVTVTGAPTTGFVILEGY